MFVGRSKVCQRTQPLSCSRHKRNGCKTHAQAALPTMMSGLDGCLRADVTWVGSGEKEGESFHVCFSAAQCWLWTVAEQGSAWSGSIYIYSNCRFFPAVVRELNSQDQSKLQNYGSIKNYNSEFHAQKQSSGSLNFLDLDNSIIS